MRRVMAGEDAPKLYATDEDRDGDWNGAVADPAVVDDAMAAVADRDGAHRPASWPESPTSAAGTPVSPTSAPTGRTCQLRDMLVAQIAEYARHCGHADLLRERIDGRVGQ